MSSGGPVIRVLPVFVQDEQLLRKDPKRVMLDTVPTHQPLLLFYDYDYKSQKVNCKYVCLRT